VSVDAPLNDNVTIIVKPKCQVPVKKKEYSPITLLWYSWVDGEVDSFYSCYNDKVNILHFINCVNICTFMDEEVNPIHLRCCPQMLMTIQIKYF